MILSKICPKCKKKKSTNQFHLCSESKDLLFCWCKECVNKYNRERYKNNPEFRKTRSINIKKWHQENPEYAKGYRQKHKKEIKESEKKWHQNNPEYGKKYRLKNKTELRKKRKKYIQEHRKEFNKYRRNYRKNDLTFRIGRNMGAMIYRALKGKKNGQHWERFVNYNLSELMQHLEIKFNSKMSWDNYGGYWVIDHIKPRSLFKFIISDDLDFQQCWALENLQPLEKIENLKKSNIYKGDDEHVKQKTKSPRDESQGAELHPILEGATRLSRRDIQAESKRLE